MLRKWHFQVEWHLLCPKLQPQAISTGNMPSPGMWQASGYPCQVTGCHSAGKILLVSPFQGGARVNPLLQLMPHLIGFWSISIPVSPASFMIAKVTKVILKKVKHPFQIIFCDLLLNKDSWQHLPSKPFLKQLEYKFGFYMKNLLREYLLRRNSRGSWTNRWRSSNSWMMRWRARGSWGLRMG